MSYRRVLAPVLLPCLFSCAGCGLTGGDGEDHPDAWTVHVELVGRVPDVLPSVLTSRADGSVHSLTTVDASGRVDVQVPHNGRVSVFTQQSEYPGEEPQEVKLPRLRTVESYAEVDRELTFRVPMVYEPEWVAGPATFVSKGPLPPGTAFLKVSLACTGKTWSNPPHYGEPLDPTAPVVVDFMPRCSEAGESVALAMAIDEDTNLLAMKRVEHVALTPGAKEYEVSFAEPDPVALWTVHFTSESGSLSVASRAPAHPYGDYADISYDQSDYDESGTVSVSLPVSSDFFEEHVLTASASPQGNTAGIYVGTTRTMRTSEAMLDFELDPSVLAHTELLGAVDDPAKHTPVEWAYPKGAHLGRCHALSAEWAEDGQSAIKWTTRQRPRTHGQFYPPELPDELAPYRAPDTLVGVSSQNIDTELDCANVADIQWSSTVAGSLVGSL